MSCDSFPSVPVLSSLLNRTSHGVHGSSGTAGSETRGSFRLEETSLTAEQQSSRSVVLMFLCSRADTMTYPFFWLPISCEVVLVNGTRGQWLKPTPIKTRTISGKMIYRTHQREQCAAARGFKLKDVIFIVRLSRKFVTIVLAFLASPFLIGNSSRMD